MSVENIECEDGVFVAEGKVWLEFAVNGAVRGPKAVGGAASGKNVEDGFVGILTGVAAGRNMGASKEVVVDAMAGR